MATGLRIHHPSARSCVLLVAHPGDPVTGRKPKDYHIHLDADGDAIVSETVWRRLQEAERSGLSTHGFIVMNEVLDPPTIAITRTIEGTSPVVPVRRQGGDGVVGDAELQAIAQQFAPKGVGARITTKES